MKEIILIVILLAGIVAIFKLGKPKKKKNITISKRALTSMSKLATVEATIKSLVVAIDDDDKQFGGTVLGWLTKDRYYVESVISTVKASVSMDDFSDENVKINPLQNTVTINLPYPKVEKANFLGEKSEVIWKKGGEFEVKELRDFREQKENDINNDPKIHKIVEDQAKQNTEEFFVALLKTMGFADANINFKKETKSE